MDGGKGWCVNKGRCLVCLQPLRPVNECICDDEPDEFLQDCGDTDDSASP